MGVSQEVRGGGEEKVVLVAEAQVERNTAAHSHSQAPGGSGNHGSRKANGSIVYPSIGPPELNCICSERPGVNPGPAHSPCSDASSRGCLKTFQLLFCLE